MVDAAYRMAGKNEYYIFAGRHYGRVKMTPPDHESLVSGPKLITKGWNTLNNSGFGSVNTVVPVPGHDDQLYVFFGGRYVHIRLDKYDDSFVIDGAHSIESGWKALVQTGFDTVDAALKVPGSDTDIYFFRGLHYVRINSSSGKLMGKVTPIKTGWPSIVKAGFDSVDAIVSIIDQPGHYYVFYGSRYAVVRLDNAGHDTLISAAKPISDGWTSLDDWV
ncbi:unnamed protein product [Penicillium salamii]|nr:unnamed protein product [Penicillium salamii]CAG8387206.1 unnamed protein product [Penicillium salamii]